MALLDPNPPKSDAEKLVDTLKELRGHIINVYDAMGGVYDRCMKLVWDNPYGLSPEQVIQFVDKDAYQLFKFGSLLRMTLNAVHDGRASPPPAQYLVSPQPDGTCIITLLSSSSSGSPSSSSSGEGQAPADGE